MITSTRKHDKEFERFSLAQLAAALCANYFANRGYNTSMSSQPKHMSVDVCVHFNALSEMPYLPADYAYTSSNLWSDGKVETNRIKTFHFRSN